MISALRQDYQKWLTRYVYRGRGLFSVIPQPTLSGVCLTVSSILTIMRINQQQCSIVCRVWDIGIICLLNLRKNKHICHQAWNVSICLLCDSVAEIHADAPPFVEMSIEQEILETGLKVVDLLAPYAKGGKIGNYTLFCRDWDTSTHTHTHARHSHGFRAIFQVNLSQLFFSSRATGYASQHIWSLSQARVNWEGCVRKGIRHKNGGMAEMGAPISVDGVAIHPDCWCVCLCYLHFAPENPEDGKMYLLVPAHPGCPG